MFNGLWPSFDTEEVPIASVTNGVHAPTWVAREVIELAARAIGRDLTEEARGWEAIDAVPESEIWAVRRTLRGQLVDEARARLKASWLQRGAQRQRARLGRRGRSTPTSSPSASPVACRRTSGSR